MKEIITAQLNNLANGRQSLLQQKQQLAGLLQQVESRLLMNQGAEEASRALLAECEKLDAACAAQEEAEEAEAQAEADAEASEEAKGNGEMPPAIAERLGGELPE
jgi:hypothetical protein